jgi:hypothetical protein
MDSSIIITLKSEKDSSLEQIKIRPRLELQGFVVSYQNDGVSWIVKQTYHQAITYIYDFLNLISVSRKHLDTTIQIKIPGFPEMEFPIYELNEKKNDSINSRIADYMMNKWSPYNN